MFIKGNEYKDARGKLYFNNNFDASQVKRIYTIENSSLDFIRGWQGHRIEQRWFSAVLGSFEISLIEVDNWEQPSINLKPEKYILEEGLNILHIPAGFITAIQTLQENAKLLVMADYHLGEIKDEYRFPINYFTNC
jgi:dTDP-4-dehydrorhamnose 3,5-epimerase-like enzyme